MIRRTLDRKKNITAPIGPLSALHHSDDSEEIWAMHEKLSQDTKKVVLSKVQKELLIQALTEHSPKSFMESYDELWEGLDASQDFRRLEAALNDFFEECRSVLLEKLKECEHE